MYEISIGVESVLNDVYGLTARLALGAEISSKGEGVFSHVAATTDDKRVLLSLLAEAGVEFTERGQRALSLTATADKISVIVPPPYRPDTRYEAALLTALFKYFSNAVTAKWLLLSAAADKAAVYANLSAEQAGTFYRTLWRTRVVVADADYKERAADGADVVNADVVAEAYTERNSDISMRISGEQAGADYHQRAEETAIDANADAAISYYTERKKDTTSIGKQGACCCGCDDCSCAESDYHQREEDTMRVVQHGGFYDCCPDYLPGGGVEVERDCCKDKDKELWERVRRR